MDDYEWPYDDDMEMYERRMLAEDARLERDSEQKEEPMTEPRGIRLIDYERDYSKPFAELRDGDRLWRTCPVTTQVFLAEGAVSLPGFHDYVTFVASLNVDMKFKVYYAPDTWVPWRVALDGKKLPMECKRLAETLFLHLVEFGWEFHV